MGGPFARLLSSNSSRRIFWVYTAFYIVQSFRVVCVILRIEEVRSAGFCRGVEMSRAGLEVARRCVRSFLHPLNDETFTPRHLNGSLLPGLHFQGCCTGLGAGSLFSWLSKFVKSNGAFTKIFASRSPSDHNPHLLPLSSHI